MLATQRRRTGFTLFGLLVLLAIIGLLLALLLPAIQKVREASNRMLCANNLRQIGIAAHNYHNDYDRLPPGYLGPKDEKGLITDDDQNVSGFALLLPYMEQDNLFKQLEVNWTLDARGPAWWTDKRAGINNRAVAQTGIKMFRCPSDTSEANLTVGTLAAVHNIGKTLDSHVLPKPNESSLGRSNYAGVLGCLGRVPDKEKDAAFFSTFDGMLGNRTQLTLGQVTVQDGTSNTLMYGEGLGGLPKGPRDRAWSWMGVGAVGTYYGLTPDPPNDNPSTSFYRFGSRHPRGVQFCFGDCSTRLIRYGQTAKVPDKLPENLNQRPTDWLLLQQLAGRNDGLNHDLSPLLD